MKTSASPHADIEQLPIVAYLRVAVVRYEHFDLRAGGGSVGQMLDEELKKIAEKGDEVKSITLEFPSEAPWHL